MTNIYCSNKLAGLINPKSGQPTADGNCNWNAHLFTLARKKCIIFTHKKTLFSFVLLDIVKKDLLDLNAMLLNAFISQLKTDNIFIPDKNSLLSKVFLEVKLFSTDNDRKIIGSINDLVSHIKWNSEREENKLVGAKNYIACYLNAIPMKTINYKYSKELMADEIKNLK